MKNYIKLSEYAKTKSVSYGTALRHFHLGKVNGYQDKDTLTIYVEKETPVKEQENTVAIYSRVSSHENKENAERQLERLRMYAMAKGYRVVKEVIEIASGLNDKRPKLEKLLQDNSYTILLVEHKDRLTRFGFHYIQVLLEKNNQKVEVVNEVVEEKKDLIEDLVAIVTSCCARLYGQRRTKRKTEQIIEVINDVETKNSTIQGKIE